MVKIIDTQFHVFRKITLVILLLWLMVLGSAIAVVYVTYDTRVKFNTLESLRREHNRLQVVWGQYLLERSTWASYGRIEKISAEKLSMSVPSAQQVIMVTDDES